MKFVICLGFFAYIYVFTFGDDIFLDKHCEGKPNGNYDIACRAYISCTNGKAHQVHCGIGEVYNYLIQACDQIFNTPKPCGEVKDCAHQEDGTYLDESRADCQYYYTCLGGTFIGEHICPANLVFNETLGICDWPANVLPPCGHRVD